MALKRSVQINGVSGLCITKLDVMDGIDCLKLGVGYKIREGSDDIVRTLPTGAEALAQCEPVYEEMPGWTENTAGIKDFSQLPKAAQNYLKRIEEICEVSIAMISTGPDREETILLQHPFE